MQIPLLTKKEAKKAINAQNIGPNKVNGLCGSKKSTAFLGHIQTKLSFDLGKTTHFAEVKEKCLVFGNYKILLSNLEKLKEDTIYAVVENKLLSVELFSQETNLYYKLWPTTDWPTIMLSSVPMHRFKTSTPKASAGLMVRELFPIEGVMLDTCAGLGYTSILLANEAGCKKVIVFEKDKNVLEIAKYNPFSEELFTNKKIELKNESVFDGIKKIPNQSIAGILHDPPTTSFAPELYSQDFYEQLYRVLKPGALLFHYCPNPGKTKGKEFWHTIIKKLKKTGFVNIEYKEKSSGITAQKKK
jgi:predicted methyltransferase